MGELLGTETRGKQHGRLRWGPLRWWWGEFKVVVVGVSMGQAVGRICSRHSVAGGALQWPSWACGHHSGLLRHLACFSGLPQQDQMVKQAASLAVRSCPQLDFLAVRMAPMSLLGLRFLSLM